MSNTRATIELPRGGDPKYVTLTRAQRHAILDGATCGFDYAWIDQVKADGDQPERIELIEVLESSSRIPRKLWKEALSWASDIATRCEFPHRVAAGNAERELRYAIDYLDHCEHVPGRKS
jgi:hypothetical protein